MSVIEDADELLHFFYEEINIKGKQIVDTKDVVNTIKWSSDRINSSFNYLKDKDYLVIGQMGSGNFQGVEIFRIMRLSSLGIDNVVNKLSQNSLEAPNPVNYTIIKELNMGNVSKNIGGTGITAGGDVTFGEVSGQVAIGQNITQTQTLSATDKKELLECLMQFQKEATKLGIPEEELSTVKGDLNAAIKEAKKEEPDISKIKSRFESAIDTVKEVGDTIDRVSKWEWTGKIVKLLGKLGLSVML